MPGFAVCVTRILVAGRPSVERMYLVRCGDVLWGRLPEPEIEWKESGEGGRGRGTHTGV